MRALLGAMMAYQGMARVSSDAGGGSLVGRVLAQTNNGAGAEHASPKRPDKDQFALVYPLKPLYNPIQMAVICSGCAQARWRDA